MDRRRRLDIEYGVILLVALQMPFEPGCNCAPHLTPSVAWVVGDPVSGPSDFEVEPGRLLRDGIEMTASVTIGTRQEISLARDDEQRNLMADFHSIVPRTEGDDGGNVRIAYGCVLRAATAH